MDTSVNGAKSNYPFPLFQKKQLGLLRREAQRLIAPCSNRGENRMTLIVAMRARSGEIVIASDKRSIISNADDDGYFIVDDNASKLIDFDGIIIGIAGKYGATLRIVRDFMATDKRDINTCERLGRRLKKYYREEYSKECNKWPKVEVTFCDWQGERGRILKLPSRSAFVPQEVDEQVHLSGMFHTAFPVFIIFECGDKRINHIERYCVLSLTLTAGFDSSVGPNMDIWILGKHGIVRRTDKEIKDILESINKSVTGFRDLLYP